MSVSQTQYAAFRETCLQNQPIRKTVSLTDLKFITMDCVEFSGLKLGISRQAFKDLLRVVGISKAGVTSLEESVGEENAQKFLNALKNAIGSSKGIQVTIAVTPDRIISRIQKKSDASILSAESYFETVERLANRHALDIDSMDFNKSNGNIYISTTAGKNEFQVGNFSDEVFKTGISLSRTSEGIQADPFMHRLVCTNGMITRLFDESFRIHNMNPEVWKEFYQHMERIEAQGFAPTKFNDAVSRAMQTPASLAELERGMHLLTSSSNIPEDELEIFFKGAKRTYNGLHAAGIDTQRLNHNQKRNLRTAVPVWDLINGITDFASHNYGYEKKANTDRHLQLQAGDILGSQFDTANLIMNQPF